MKVVEVQFKKLRDNAVIPSRESENAGGWDVVVADIEYGDKGLVICYLGFALAFPKEYKLTLVPRSSLTKTTYILQNSPGLGDADYRGEYQYRFRGIPTVNDYGYPIYDDFPFKVGDRIGQVYLENVIPVSWKLTEELDETVRGSGGFGHTGS